MRVGKNGNHHTIAAGDGFDFKSAVNKTDLEQKAVYTYGVGLAIICAIAIFFPGAGTAILTFASKVMDTVLGSVISSMLGGPGNLKKGLIVSFLAAIGLYLFDSYQLGVIYNGL